MARLKAKKLIKSYNNKRNVVNGVSLHVDTGEIVGLLSPNGAGKTTSFFILASIYQGGFHIPAQAWLAVRAIFKTTKKSNWKKY